jgi:hypothetical protein
VETFAGTIMKSGDKYALQDASATNYDIDRQDLVKSHQGKKVLINGTLDPDDKTIHVSNLNPTSNARNGPVWLYQLYTGAARA